MESIELNPFVTAKCPRIEKFPIESFTAEQAEQKRLEKDYLTRDVFMHLGPEHHMEIVAILKNKCFDGMKDEDISKHIMHRVVNGTMINRELERDVEFIYDERDRAVETFLSYIAFADTMERARGIIDAIHFNPNHL